MIKLELPCPVLLRGAYPEAARRLGLTEDDVERIAWGTSAFRDGRVMAWKEFDELFPEDDFNDFTGDEHFPEDLLTTRIEVPRDPAVLMTAPITAHDRAAASAWVAMQRFRRLRELNAPSILLAAERANLREACASVEAETAPWQPMAELMTGAPASPGAAGEAHAMFGVPFGDRDATGLVDVAWLPDGLVVFWPYATLVFALDGTVRDAFPTRGLRAVGGDSSVIGLVCGGGPAASSGYFGAEVFVRDVVAHEWRSRGSLIPPTIPRYVAGTIGDVKWAVVVDAREGVGYRTSPVTSGDQCGEAFNSACGGFVWDRGRFVLEAATGIAVLDVKRLEGTFVGFARGTRGWRFLMLDEPQDEDLPDDAEPPPLLFRLKDETNAVIRSLDKATLACALSPDANRLVEVTDSALVVTDADSGRQEVTFDLSNLTPALRLPRSSELWQSLAAVYGTPAQLATQGVEEVLTTTKDLWGTFEAGEVAEAMEEARRCPRLPGRVAVSGPSASRGTTR